jgi:hypothetical protein
MKTRAELNWAAIRVARRSRTRVPTESYASPHLRYQQLALRVGCSSSGYNKNRIDTIAKFFTPD